MARLELFATALAAAALAVACNSSNNSPPPAGTLVGGAAGTSSGTGGTSATGGGPSTGGSTSTGGSAGSNTDGGPTTGGAGGMPSTGGAAGAGTGGDGATGGGSAGEGGGPGRMCQLSTGSADCDQCALRVCNDQCIACEDNPACTAILDCVKRDCLGSDGKVDAQCAQGCFTANPNGHDDWNLLAGGFNGCVPGFCAGFCSFF